LWSFLGKCSSTAPGDHVQFRISKPLDVLRAKQMRDFGAGNPGNDSSSVLASGRQFFQLLNFIPGEPVSHARWISFALPTCPDQNNGQERKCYINCDFLFRAHAVWERVTKSGASFCGEAPAS
jgi:hypothetical protein